MKKSIALTLALCLCLSLATFSLAGTTPAVLEAPKNFSAYMENGSATIRWTLPQSIVDSIDGDIGGDVYYCIDYKIDDGLWRYDTAKVTETLYDADSPLKGYVGNLFYDENNVQESFIIPASIGAGDEFNLVAHTYYFRMRFFLSQDDVTEFLTSAWSNTAAIGKNANAASFTSLEAPTGLKAFLKYGIDQKPYFTLTWNNPQSVVDINKSYSLIYKVDFKVGDGKWFSETATHDWWSGLPLATSGDFNPIEKQLVDGIEIEKNTYYFRILYAFEPVDAPRVYSGFSNIASLGTPAFYSKASDYAVSFLNEADSLGIITPRLQGQDMTQYITREEFAEIAVKFYEMATGETAVPVLKNPFKDSTNVEVLKAYNLKITAGTGDGTTFEPKKNLLRQQMATMITNTLRACFTGFDLGNYNLSGQANFKDQGQFAAYAINPAKFMAKYGITAGDGKGNFIPNNYCTRQEAIIFLVKAYDARAKFVN